MGDMLVRKLTGSWVNPVVALNSALRFTPLEIMPRCSLRVMGPSLRGRLRPGRAHAPEGSPSLRAGGLSEPEAGAEPGPAAKGWK